MVVRFPTKRMIQILIGLVLLLSILHVTSYLLHHAYENRVTELLVEKFSFDLERNFPTYFSALLLFGSSISFFLIAGATKNTPTINNYRFWAGLSVIFLFLSTDEAVHIHEHFDTSLIWGPLKPEGLLAWPWVIVYGTFVTLFVLAYLNFWWRLPPVFKWSYFAAGSIYVGSALGFEMLEALEYASNNSTYTTKYYVLTSLEEFFEMSAIVFLVYTNMKYLALIFPKTTFSFGAPSVEHG